MMQVFWTTRVEHVRGLSAPRGTTMPGQLVGRSRCFCPAAVRRASGHGCAAEPSHGICDCSRFRMLDRVLPGYV